MPTPKVLHSLRMASLLGEREAVWGGSGSLCVALTVKAPSESAGAAVRKYLRWAAQKRQAFAADGSGGWKSKVRTVSPPLGHRLLAVSSHGEGAREPWGLLCKGADPTHLGSTLGTASRHHCLWDEDFSTYVLEKQRHPVHSTYSGLHFVY